MASLKGLIEYFLCREFTRGFEIMIILLIILGFAAYLIAPRSVVNAEHVGNAVTGFTTSAGILAAFLGFWLAHLNSSASDLTKKWLQKRIAVIVPFIGLCLFIIFSGLYQLVFENFERAVNSSALGLLLLVFLVGEISYITFYQGFSKEPLQ